MAPTVQYGWQTSHPMHFSGSICIFILLLSKKPKGTFFNPSRMRSLKIIQLRYHLAGVPVNQIILLNFVNPALWAGNQWLGFQRGAASLWARGGVNAPPENASVQGGRRSPCREVTLALSKSRGVIFLGMSVPL